MQVPVRGHTAAQYANQAGACGSDNDPECLGAASRPPRHSRQVSQQLRKDVWVRLLFDLASAQILISPVCFEGLGGPEGAGEEGQSWTEEGKH